MHRRTTLSITVVAVVLLLVPLLMVGPAAPRSAALAAPPASQQPSAEALAAAFAAGAGGLPVQAYVPITPCRIADTRAGGGRIAAGATRHLHIRGTTGFPAQGGAAGGCGIPESSNAITVSVSSVTVGGVGYFRAWPHAQAGPNGTIAHYQPGPITTTGATMTLGSGAYDVSIRAYDAPAGIVVDVTGYWATGEQVHSTGLGTPAVWAPQHVSSQVMQTITTTTTGRWWVSKSFIGDYSCKNPSTTGAWYYVTVDGKPVVSSAVFRPYSATVLYLDALTGVTDDVIPAGVHTVSVGMQCPDGYTAGGYGVVANSRTSVTVIP